MLKIPSPNTPINGIEIKMIAIPAKTSITPMGIFDFHHDPVVLIGKEMWDTIGGTGCYEELIDIAQAVGVETKQTISRMFNGR